MTIRITKPKFNLREKLSELDKPTGLKGNELMRSDTTQDARDLISAGRRNKIINGAMLIDQRHNGSSNSSSNGYHTDRFRTQAAGMDQLNQSYQQVSDGPDGFPKSLKITTNTAESNIASTGEYLALYQKIEGQNLQDLAYGTISAKPVTVSFYVKSSITGTFCYTVYRNETTDRAINKTYTIDNANTWERKSITLEGDTVQAIGNDNADNWWNVWILGSSPGYYSAPTSVWANYSGSNWAGFHEENGLITTQNATWQITGVQIEVGENATEFEHRPYAEELTLCERYYEVHWQNHNPNNPAGAHNDGYNAISAGGVAGSKVYFPFKYRTQKRASPTLEYSGKFRISGGSGGSANNVTPDEFYSPSIDGGRLRFPQSGGSNGDGMWLEFDGGNSTNGYIAIEAEL